MDVDKLKSEISKRMPRKRYKHVLRVTETAIILAKLMMFQRRKQNWRPYFMTLQNIWIKKSLQVDSCMKKCG